MKYLVILLVSILCSAFFAADTPIVIPEITKVAADRYGNLYLCDKNYNITKYDKDGKAQEVYSPKKFAEITSFEAWSSINLLLFYKDYQEYILLDRFLTEKGSATFNPDVVGFARVASLSYDNNIWLIDDQDFSLKKYNIKYGNVTVNNPLDLILDPDTYNINDIREYQNNLYANDFNTGVLVFDNLGNYKKKITIKGLEQLAFYKDEMYYLKNDSIHFHHLYLPETRSIPIPKKYSPKKLLITDNGYFFFEHKKMSIQKQ